MQHAVMTPLERPAGINLLKPVPSAGNIARRKRGLPQIKEFNVELNHAEI
jgi:hypothetical protein